MSFEGLFMLAGALIVGTAGFKRYRAYKKLLAESEVAPAKIVGTGENNKTGRYYLVEFKTEGGVHRLPYPMPNKGDFFAVGQDVTLHYDINNLEKLFIEEDKAEMQGITFYISMTALLVVFTLLLW